MKILVLLLSICPALTVLAQEPESRPNSRSFIRIDRVGNTRANSFFVFTTSDRHYTVRQDGLVESDFAELKRRRTFKMKTEGGRLERLFVAEFQGDLLMAYEVSNGNSGWAYLARLNQKARTFRWITSITGTNLGPGLIDEGAVYLTAQNLLAKLELQSGDYVWQSEVKQKSAPAFVEFVLPEIHGQRVTFRENGQRARVIQADKESGDNLQLILTNVRQP